MSTTATRLPLVRAQPVAEQLVADLAPWCIRLEVAGSIRRQRPDVGDIELVAIPQFRNEPSSLWGDEVPVNVLFERINVLAGEGTLERLSGAERYVKLVHAPSGLQLDLFLATPDNWGLIFLIRTGPADYSQWLVSEARRRGHHVSGGHLWRGTHPHGVECSCAKTSFSPVPTPEERDVYTALAMPWVDPRDRRAPWETGS